MGHRWPLKWRTLSCRVLIILFYKVRKPTACSDLMKALTVLLYSLLAEAVWCWYLLKTCKMFAGPYKFSITFMWIWYTVYNKFGDEVLWYLITFSLADNQGWGRGYPPKPKVEADKPYRDLLYSGYHKKPNIIIVLLYIERKKNHGSHTFTSSLMTNNTRWLDIC